MLKKFGISLSALGLAFVPYIALAQGGSTGGVNRVIGFIDDFKLILDRLLPIFITIALLYFVWGMIEYIMAAGDPEKRKEGRGRMIWGIVALFVIVSVWGLVFFIADVFRVDQGGLDPTDIPSVPAGRT